MKISEPPKHQIVREKLTEAIRRGDYKPGERLPAERDLAVIYGVSYMTARRAVTEMVEVDLLTRRSREGTYVLSNSDRRLAVTTVHLICPAFDSSSIRAFLRLGTRAAEARDWRAETIRVDRKQVRAAMRPIQNGAPAIVLAAGPELDGPLGEAMQSARGRAVLVGNRMDDLGVPSVLCDDAQGVQLAMENFRAHGHRDIAVVTDDPDHPIARVQIAAWKSELAGELDDIEKRVIAVETPRHANHAECVYLAIREFLEANQSTTALLCLIDGIALPALAACRDVGRPAPTQMSVIAAGNSPTMAYTHPPMTCIDVHMEEHIAQAMQLLERAMNDQYDPNDLLRLVEPHLVERESVGEI